MAREEIAFKKQRLGQWRRTDKDGSKHVNEESMFREVEKLINDGWNVQPYGVTHLREIIVSRNLERSL